MAWAKLSDAMEAVAKTLRELGYPSATPAMVREVYDALTAGRRGYQLPHGMIGMLAETQLNEHYHRIVKLKD